jgi:PAS domain S-box-containing protein
MNQKKTPQRKKDISKANSELNKTEEILNRSQKIFSDLVENAPYGIYVIDSRFRIAQMNLESQNGAFKNVRPLIGRDFGEVMHILWPGHVAEGIISNFRHTLRTGEPFYSPPFINPRNDVEIVESYEWELRRITLPDGQYGVICYYFDSTKLRDAEKAVKESEEKYRNIVETAGEGIVIAKPTGQFTYVNKKWCEMLGYSPEEMLGKTAGDFAFDNSESKKVLQNRTQLKAGETLSGEFSYRKKNGNILITSYNATPIFDTDGNHIANLAMHSDITEKKHAEKALLESEQRLRFHYENSPLGVVEWDADFIVTHWSKEAERIFGWTKEEILGKREEALNILCPEDIPIVNNIIERLKSGKEAVIISPNRNLTRSGAIIDCIWYNSVLQGENGKMKSIMSLVEDITERKQAQEALAESEMRARHLIKYAPTAIYELDFRTKKIVALNDAMVLLSGYSREELLSMDISQILDEESNMAFGSRIEKMLKGEKQDDQVEYKVKAKDGHIICALLNVKFNLNEHGIPTGALVVGQDITERKLSEETLQKNEKLLKTVLDNVNSGVALIDETGKFSVYNPLFLKLFGLSQDSTVKNVNDQNWADWKVYNEDGSLLHVDDHPVRKAAITGKKVDQKLVGVKLPSGEEITWMLISAEPMFTEKGRIDRIVCTYHDITGQKKAEASLKESEVNYRNIVETAAEGIVMVNPGGNFQFINQRFAEMLGYTAQEILGKISNEFMYDEQEVSKIQQSRVQLDKGERVQKDMKFKRKDGSLLWTLYNATPLFDSKNIHIGNLAMHSDITERKKMEEELKKSNETYMELVTNARSMIFKMDSNGIITFVNEFALNFFGYNENEILGKTPSETVTPHLDSSGRNLDLMVEKIYEDPDKFAININENIKKNGELVWIEWHNKALFDKDGNHTGHIAIGIDVTDKIKAEVSLKESEERFRTLYHGLPYNTIVLRKEDDDLVLRDYNKAAIEFTGGKISELVGLKVSNLYSSYPEILENINQCYTNKESRVLEVLLGTITANKDLFVRMTFSFVEPDRVIIITEDISSRKQAEEALRESEQRLKFHFENSPLAVVEWDSDIVITQWSKEAEHIFGWAKEEVLGKRIDTLNIIYSEDVPIVNNTIEKLASGKEAVVISSNRNLTSSGAIIECTWYNSVLHDEKGNMKSVMSLVEDITRRKKTEAALRESEANYRNIVETAGEGIIISNLDGDFQFVNQKFADMMGYTPEEIVGKKSNDFMFDDLDAGNTITRREDLRKGETLQDSVKWRTKNGSLLWTSYNATPLYDSQGLHTGNLVMHTNITERKQAEIKLKEAQDKLNLALEKGNIGIWEWNLKTDEVNWDQRLEKMFGLEPGTFGKTFNAFESLVNEEDISHVLVAIKNALEKDLPIDTVFRTNSKGVKTKYINTKSLVIKDKDGKPVSMMGVCFDVTGLKEGTEELISKINLELLRSNKELENFAYVASHDLQEPLRMVSSFTQLLEQQYKDKLDDKALEYIHFAVDGSKRMYDLLNSLLAYSRIHTKGKEFNRIELTQVLEGATKNLALTIKERNAVIKSDDLPVVRGDMVQLIQLFQNLIGNAIKFSIESPQIYISSESNQDYFLISVKDEGMGIESQYFEKIFQIFQKLHTKEQFEGTGIGLAICKRIVERYGGRIWVESEYGKGSTFFFTIPKNNQ